MDNLQPPEELRALWLDPKPQEENTEMIVARVLREAKKEQERLRAFDIIMITALAMLAPLGVLAYSLFGSPFLFAGGVLTSAGLAAGLWAYRVFYRSLRDSAPPDATSRTYIEDCIHYLERRERFLTRCNRLMPPFSLLASFSFACAAHDGQVFVGVWGSACSLLTLPLGWYMTVVERRRLRGEMDRLRQVVEDADAAV
jgi:hypothetical protein